MGTPDTGGTGRPRIDVRRIVLDILGENPEAARLYLLDPAMRHGVEITIGVLGRAAEVLTTTAGHSHPEAEALIRAIAVRCSQPRGPEDLAAIAAANSQLFPMPGTSL